MQLTSLDRVPDTSPARRFRVIRAMAIVPLAVTALAFAILLATALPTGGNAAPAIGSIWGLALVGTFVWGTTRIWTTVEVERKGRAIGYTFLWLGYLLVLAHVSALAGVFALIAFAAP